MKAIIYQGLPSKRRVEKLTDNIMLYMFPGMKGGTRLRYPGFLLLMSLACLLFSVRNRIPASPFSIARDFIGSLPGIRNLLCSDAESIAGNDPAASGTEEVILTYPGFFAITVYRLASRLAAMGVPLVPRIMTEYAHSRTGIDIHPGATIGSPFFIDHGTGIVIGETALIGDNVKLYQGVTIGALSVHKKMANTRRHPTIEDNVIIYAGSTILGGGTVIGHDSIIGGNVWLTSSVPPWSVVYHENIIKVRERNDFGNGKTVSNEI